jgi:hypothetical protein
VKRTSLAGTSPALQPRRATSIAAMSIFFISIIGTRHLAIKGNVRYGSLADITVRSRHVRFTPDSGHSSVHLDGQR